MGSVMQIFESKINPIKAVITINITLVVKVVKSAERKKINNKFRFILFEIFIILIPIHGMFIIILFYADTYFASMPKHMHITIARKYTGLILNKQWEPSQAPMT